MTRDWFSKKSQASRWKLADTTAAIPIEEFNEKTLRLAHLITANFPDRQQRIGLWGPNSSEYLVALFAVLRAGHTAVPINDRFSLREVTDLAQHVHLNGLLAAREFPLAYRNALGLPIMALAPSREETLAGDTVRLRELGDKDTAVILCSSGSSGKIKAVPFTLRSLLDHAVAVCKHLQVTWRDAWIASLPFFHIGGLMVPFRCLVSGATLHIARTGDPDVINHFVDFGGATLVSTVPTVLERMFSRREGKPFPESLRAVIVGGGPVSEDLLRRVPQAYATYGLTEAGSMVTCARPGCRPPERMTAGPPIPGTQVRILNDAGKETKVCEPGQIVVRGPGMAHSYVGGTKAGATEFRSGWLFTGDIGFLDEQGYLHVQARRTDVVLSGGENIYPAEIEQVLRTHPRIRECVVLPLADPKWGQTPGALIVLNPGRPLQTIHIHKFLDGKLARYKFPRVIVFTDKIPLLRNGKVDVAAVRKLLEERRL